MWQADLSLHSPLFLVPKRYFDINWWVFFYTPILKVLNSFKYPALPDITWTMHISSQCCVFFMRPGTLRTLTTRSRRGSCCGTARSTSDCPCDGHTLHWSEGDCSVGQQIPFRVRDYLKVGINGMVVIIAFHSLIHNFSCISSQPCALNLWRAWLGKYYCFFLVLQFLKEWARSASECHLKSKTIPSHWPIALIRTNASPVWGGPLNTSFMAFENGHFCSAWPSHATVIPICFVSSAMDCVSPCSRGWDRAKSCQKGFIPLPSQAKSLFSFDLFVETPPRLLFLEPFTQGSELSCRSRLHSVTPEQSQALTRYVHIRAS